MPDIRDRFERNTTGPVELGKRPDHVPDKAREVDIRMPFLPSLPSLEGLNDTDQIANAHSGAHHAAKTIRQAADRAWLDEPRVSGVILSPAQKLAWRREHVKAVVASELEKATPLLRQVVEQGRKELESRRAALTAKGAPKLDGVPAQKALMIASHFSTLPAETRSLRIIEALNSLDQPASKELCEAVAWCGENLDLCAPETMARIRGALVASSDPAEYQALTTYDVASQAVSESLDNLQKWGLSLADEY